MVSLNDLDDYCLYEIFDNLTKKDIFTLFKVSIRSKNIAKRTLPRFELDLFDIEAIYKVFDKVEADQICSEARNVLFYLIEENLPMLSENLKNCTNIQQLSLSSGNLGILENTNYLPLFAQLRKLKLTEIFTTNQLFVQKCLDVNNNVLDTLCIDDCAEEIILKFFTNLGNLKSLSLCNCNIENGEHEIVEFLNQNQKTLRKLTIHFSSSFFTESTVKNMVKCNLESIDFAIRGSLILEEIFLMSSLRNVVIQLYSYDQMISLVNILAESNVVEELTLAIQYDFPGDLKIIVPLQAMSSLKKLTISEFCPEICSIINFLNYPNLNELALTSENVQVINKGVLLKIIKLVKSLYKLYLEGLEISTEDERFLTMENSEIRVFKIPSK